MVYWGGDFMKARHFFRPALQMFDFKGIAGQAEYLRYTVGTWLVTAFLAMVVFGLFTFNWVYIVPPDLLDESGRLLLLPPVDFFTAWLYLLAVALLFLFAVTVRRLRDAGASLHHLLWVAPFPLGLVVLFAVCLRPTFVDYPITRPDAHGRVVMKSEQMAERRTAFRSKLGLAAIEIILGAAIKSVGTARPSGEMQLEGGRKVKTSAKARVIKADGTLNRHNTIFGRAKAHMRAGRPVKASSNKRTL